MAAGIAHEINQPLAAILSYNQACVRMLQDDEANIEEIVAAMKSAAAQSQRVGAIIARLRAFVSKQLTHRGPVDLNQVVKNSLVLIEHTLRDKQVTVTVNLLQPLPAIIADSIQLEQIVLNLIRNAIDAMEAVAPAERCVNITTAQDGNSVRVTVQDHGDGIAPDVFAQLFDPFFTTKEDGMGLGL